ncbi:MAG: GNAT family N-acetyltransferase [Humibacillus sp.]|nr:GNAT family N-acetyltransferase [Humibacillus sp.]MDN5778114.1 GNAT family N-acetyltransferase [Humibacillus sp.]
MTSQPEVALRALSVEDAGTIAGWADDPVFCRAADWTVGLHPDEYLAFQAGLIAEPPADLVRLGAALDARLIGYVALQGGEVGQRELGFVIGERALWGRGLGMAVASAGLCHGFVAMGLTQIWGEGLAANAASVRILERLGMRETGVGEQGTYLGQPSHYRRFSISRDEFVSC